MMYHFNKRSVFGKHVNLFLSTFNNELKKWNREKHSEFPCLDKIEAQELLAVSYGWQGFDELKESHRNVFSFLSRRGGEIARDLVFIDELASEKGMGFHSAKMKAVKAAIANVGIKSISLSNQIVEAFYKSGFLCESVASSRTQVFRSIALTPTDLSDLTVRDELQSESVNVTYGGNALDYLDLAIDINSRRWAKGGGSFWLLCSVEANDVSERLVEHGVSPDKVTEVDLDKSGILDSSVLTENVLKEIFGAQLDSSSDSSVWIDRAVFTLGKVVEYMCRTGIELKHLNELFILDELVKRLRDKGDTELVSFLNTLPCFDWDEIKAGKDIPIQSYEMWGFVVMQFTEFTKSVIDMFSKEGGSLFQHRQGEHVILTSKDPHRFLIATSVCTSQMFRLKQEEKEFYDAAFIEQGSKAIDGTFIKLTAMGRRKAISMFVNRYNADETCSAMANAHYNIVDKDICQSMFLRAHDFVRD